MQTYVVAIDFKLADNFAHLPLSYIDELNGERVRIVINATPMAHLEPDEESGLSKVNTNYDVAILAGSRTDKYKDLTLDGLCTDKIFLIERLGKDRMRYQLDKAAEGQKNYMPIVTYCQTPLNPVLGAYNEYCFSGRSDRDYLIKANDGARGAGQIIVPSYYNPLAVYQKFSNGDGINHTELLQKYPDVIICTEGENHKGEGKDMMSQQGIIIQHIVRDIDAEYRLLVGPDAIYACTRKNRGGAFPQATGVSDRYDYHQANGELTLDMLRLPGTITDEIRETIGKLGLVGISMDLFVTKEGKWGFFEYSSQFGTAAFYTDFMRRFHKDIVLHALKTTLK